MDIDEQIFRERRSGLDEVQFCKDMIQLLERAIAMSKRI